MKITRILTVVLGLMLIVFLAQTGLRLGWLDSYGAFAEESNMSENSKPGVVQVHVFNKDGELVGPVKSSKVVKTDEEWKELLTPEQFKILRKEGTERAFCGTLLDNKKEGVYACAACGLPLYTSDAKFNSGTGWPSFFQTISPGNVAEKSDNSHGMTRTEIECARCDSHLGHVFDDGPAPTGKRHCLNSESLVFTESDKLAELADPSSELTTIVLAGGCFWCTEAVFEPVEGVVDVVSGYAGGMEDSAKYPEVSSGQTKHAEVIQVTYDPNRVSLDKLFELFFHIAHDPTQLNQQGNDIGTQYRSAVFYADDEQKQAAEAYIKQLEESGKFDKPIATILEPLNAFYPAEKDHQDFVSRNPNQPYVRAVAIPKIKKLKKEYNEILKED